VARREAEPSDARKTVALIQTYSPDLACFATALELGLDRAERKGRLKRRRPLRPRGT
jgi:hypothetical protein